ncbi:MAG: hypothetical protein IKX76_00430, partial [Eubacterium sp.]|nr:hypothetical protein [Eubacterium sp.]
MADRQRAGNRESLNWRLHFNIGTVVFLLILIFLAGNLIRYAGKKKLAVYEVSNSEITDTIKGTGVILRKEKVYTTKEDGYIHNYLPDGARVKSNGIVYTLDKTGKIQEEVNRIIEKNENASYLDTDTILDELRTFTDSYDDSIFY